MKVSVTSYSYSQAYSDQFTIFDAMDHAKAHGADGFEFAGFDVPEGMTKEDRARELRAYSEKIGLPIAAYAIGAWLLRLEEPRLMLQWTVGKALAKVRGRAARR